MCRRTATSFVAVMLTILFLTVRCAAQEKPASAPKSINETIFESMMKDAKSALDIKAAYRWTMLDTWYGMPDQEGSGPYPATYAAAPDGKQFVVFQPKNLAAAAAKRKLGVYVWGTGGCSADANPARFHLTEIASNGYIAISPGQILTGPHANGTPPDKADAVQANRNTWEKMVAAIDWILAENIRQGSPYFGLIDTNHVVVGGNSCGGLIAIKASLDPRVKLLVMENSGIFISPPPGLPAGTTPPIFTKGDLAKLHVPVLYILGGPQDAAEPNGLDDFKRIQNVPIFVADQPGAGHIGLFLEPNGESTKIELDWLKWHFNGDKGAAKTFVGTDCRLCTDFRWVVSREGIE